MTAEPLPPSVYDLIGADPWARATAEQTAAELRARLSAGVGTLPDSVWVLRDWLIDRDYEIAPITLAGVVLVFGAARRSGMALP